MKQHKTPVYVVNKHHKPLMPTYRFGHIEYADGKSFKSIYCKPIGSGSVQYVDVKPIDTIIDEIEKSDLAKNAA